MSTNKARKTVAAYSAAHFAVDFACAFLVFRYIAGTPESYICVLLYNFCAFAMQMPIGVIADRLNRNYRLAAVGALLVAAAYAIAFRPVAAALVAGAIVAGTGNALFHIGGGIDVLNISGKKLGALGAFVSPGAFGVYFGTMLGRSGGVPEILIPAAMAAAAGMIVIVQRLQRASYPENAAFSLDGAGKAIAAIACFFIVVCLRSFSGLALDFTWKSAGFLSIALICAVVFGKALGGFVADRFGPVKVSVASLGVAAFLLLFPSSPPAGIVAVALLNMTMPVTLWAAAKTMPGAKGFAFGLLSFGLFLGFVPVYLGARAPAELSWGFVFTTLISLALLWAGLRPLTAGAKRAHFRLDPCYTVNSNKVLGRISRSVHNVSFSSAESNMREPSEPDRTEEL